MALHDVTFDMRPGEIVVLLGPNGAGKTTLFRCLTGLLDPSSGRIRVFDDAPRGRKVRSRIAYLTEIPDLYAGLSVIEHIRFISLLHGLDHEQDRAISLLESFGLSESQNLLPHELSQGMRKKLALSMALMQGASLLLLDEPFNGLDPKAARELRDSILQITRHGASVLISTHRLAEAETFADRALILNHGKLLADGSLEQLITSSSGITDLESVFFKLTDDDDDD